MISKIIRLLTVTLFIMGIAGAIQPGYAQKSKEAVKQLLENRNQQIKKILGPKGTKYSKKQREELKNVINGIIDYRAMAKYALQDTWNKITPQKRDEFVKLFSQIIRDHSLNQLDIYRANITYRSISINGDSATVKTLATRKDIRKNVVYKLFYKQNKAKWVVTDFLINDVSTAGSYRRQFQNIIEKNGFNKLMDILRKRASR